VAYGDLDSLERLVRQVDKGSQEFGGADGVKEMGDEIEKPLARYLEN